MGAVPPVGSMLLDKYRVERVLGEGGMGVVVAARHVELDDLVAIKLLADDAAHSHEMFQRFVREAKTTAKLRSEHVVRVSDVGRLPNGTPYMVMELLVGRDLMRIVRDDGRQSAKFAALIGLQVCEALAEAHGLGIVHRDLKAANLFVTSAPNGSAHVKVLDFGISKAPVTGLQGALTLESTILGTPSYMAPEQLRSTRSVDSRADIWSLGVVLYEVIEGRRPFGYPGVAYQDLLIAIASKSPPPMKYASAELAAAILRCLEKNPAERTASMLELARELGPFLSDHRAAELAINKITTLVESSALAASARAIAKAKPKLVGRFHATESMSVPDDADPTDREPDRFLEDDDDDVDEEANTTFAKPGSAHGGPQVQLGLAPLRASAPAAPGLVPAGVIVASPSQPTLMADLPSAQISPGAVADMQLAPLAPNVLVTPSLGAYSLPAPAPLRPPLPAAPARPSAPAARLAPQAASTIAPSGQAPLPAQHEPPPARAASGPSWTVLAIGAALAGAAGAIVYTLLT